MTVEVASPSIELYRPGRLGWKFPKYASDEKKIAPMYVGTQNVVFYDRGLSDNDRKKVDILLAEGGITDSRFKNDH